MRPHPYAHTRRVCICLRVSRFASRTLSLYTFHYTSLNCRCYCCCHCWLLLLCCWWCWCCRGCCCYCCCSSPMFIQLALTSFVLIKCSTYFTSTVSRSLDSFIQRFAIKFNCVCFFSRFVPIFLLSIAPNHSAKPIRFFFAVNNA